MNTPYAKRSLKALGRLSSRWLVASIGVGALCLAQPQTATAGTITLTDAVGVMWEISFLAPIDLVFVPTVPAAGNRNTIGTLTDKTVRATADPLTIHFLQLTEAPDEMVDTAGLRLLLETQVKNNTTNPWGGYRMQLVDGSFPAPFNAAQQDGNHPVEAHLHARNTATYAPFTAFNPTTSTGTASSCPDPVAADVSCNLLITDGINTVGIGNDLMVRQLLLHEREFSPIQMDGLSDPGRRFFDLVQTPAPIPEPGTLTLIVSGLVVLRSRARRSRRPQAR